MGKVRGIAWVLLALLFGCSSDGSEADGATCGTFTCPSGEICCSDCAGDGFCSSGGGVCPDILCLIDAGTDAPAPTCCTDCDGQEVCGLGIDCNGFECPEPEDGGSGARACGAGVCGRGQICVHACCGGAPLCTPPDGDGNCPDGTIPGDCVGGDVGCQSQCNPPPPTCAEELPMGCTLDADGFNTTCLCA